MKLPKFDYARPATLEEAVALLAAGNGTARLLAGGQSLVPILTLRLATPSMLVDIGRIAGLDKIDINRSPRRHSRYEPLSTPLLATLVERALASTCSKH